jgi:glycosyltransferase involved in cell wall biosynthesis
MAGRVLMVCDSLGQGGAERQLTLMATALRPDWDVTVFTLEGGHFERALEESGVPLVLAPRRFRFDPTPLAALDRELARRRPDVVHSWGWMAAFAAELCCRRRRIPHVSGVIRRGMFPHRRGWALKKASTLGTFVLANSRAGLEAFGVPAGRGRVLYNGFDPDRLERAAFDRTAPVDAARPFRAVMAATMDERKDFPLFVRAARILHEEDPGAMTFVALGGGRDHGAVVRSAADLVAAGVIEFPGRVDEVMDHYGEADVGVMLSSPIHGEGLSNSIMEFMACGLPVVCTDQGGNRELVVEGETGFLVPVSDAEALVDRLRRLAGHRDEARAMGAAGRRRIVSEFSVARMCDRAAAIYHEAIAMARDGEST